MINMALFTTFKRIICKFFEYYRIDDTSGLLILKICLITTQTALQIKILKLRPPDNQVLLPKNVSEHRNKRSKIHEYTYLKTVHSKYVSGHLQGNLPNFINNG